MLEIQHLSKEPRNLGREGGDIFVLISFKIVTLQCLLATANLTDGTFNIITDDSNCKRLKRKAEKAEKKKRHSSATIMKKQNNFFF